MEKETSSPEISKRRTAENENELLFLLKNTYKTCTIFTNINAFPCVICERWKCKERITQSQRFRNETSENQWFNNCFTPKTTQNYSIKNKNLLDFLVSIQYWGGKSSTFAPSLFNNNQSTIQLLRVQYWTLGKWWFNFRPGKVKKSHDYSEKSPVFL